jgi:hypothetical protein
MARLYWAGKGEGFSPVRSTWIPLVAHSAQDRVYEYPLGVEAAAAGSVLAERVAIEPWGAAQDSGEARFGSLELLEEEVLASWTFADRHDSLFDMDAGAMAAPAAPGALRESMADGSALLMSVGNSAWFTAEEGQAIELRLRNPSPATAVVLRWRFRGSSPEGKMNLLKRRKFEPLGLVDIRVPIEPDQPGERAYRVEPRAAAGWKGEVLTLYLDADCAPTAGAAIEIRSILVRSAR